MKRNIYIIIILFNLNFSFSQTGRIEGELMLEIEEEYKMVLAKTKVNLEIENRTIQTIVDDSLNFVFNSLPKGKFKLTLDPKSSGRHIVYSGKIRNGKTLNLSIPYSISCKYDRSKNDKTCPVCSKQDKVIPISYGLISDVYFVDKNGNIVEENGKPSERKKKNYYAGGCITSDCDPNWYCERDKTQF
jgi:hypothetical protein